MDAHVGLGLALEEGGASEEAIEHYREALRAHGREGQTSVSKALPQGPLAELDSFGRSARIQRMSNIRRWVPIWITLSLIASVGLACSISKSFESISNSFDSSSNLSSSSSPDGDDDSSYREDVRELTVAHVATEGAEGDLRAFQYSLGALAAERGVTNWEEDATTCVSIGEGLREAELDEGAARSFAANLFAEEPAGRREIERGYHSGP